MNARYNHRDHAERLARWRLAADAAGVSVAALVRATMDNTADDILGADGTTQDPAGVRLINDIRARARGRMG